MDDTLRHRTGGRERMLAVPVEWGKLSSYRWVLENRLLPMFDERDNLGAPRRTALRQRVAPSSAEAQQAQFDRTASEWQQMVEAGAACLGAPAEMGALAAMVDTLRARGIEVTVLLYPRMPVTLSTRAKETTLPEFAARVRALVEPRGVRVVDLTSDVPLADADFGGDFDHILPAANARFSGWALDGPLRFLLNARE